MTTTYRNLFYLLPLLLLWLSKPQFLSAQGGYALDFDGSDDYVDVPYNVAINPANFTVEFWVKMEGGSTTSYRSPICSRDGTLKGYVFYANVSNEWTFWFAGGSYIHVDSNVPVSNDWTHIAGTYDGTTGRIYINGVLKGSTAGAFTPNPSEVLRIGAGDTEQPNPAYYIDGKVDEVRVWSDVRTQAEIQANMNRELIGNEANLVAYYKMSDGTGTSLTDNSTNSHTGTLTNGPVWKTSGALAGPGMALNFGGGANQYVSVPNDATLNITGTALTLEAWINADVWETNVFEGVIVAKDDAFSGYGLRTGNNGQIDFFIGNGSSWEILTSSTGVLSTGIWYHLAAVLNGTSMKIYVNGVEVASGSASSSLVANALPMILGTSNGASTTRLFDGKIDEVRVWNDARTEAEIRANKDRTLTGTEAGLVAYYRFDQQADAGNTTLADITENGNNGTLVNMSPATNWIVSTPFNTWIGSEDSDWNNAGNWGSGTVPSSEDIGIFDWNAATYAPASANINGRNFYLAPGSNLSHSGNLTLSGDYYNAGTFTTSGTVSFSGSTSQSLRGSGTSTFGGMTINNSNGVTMDKDVNVNTTLTLTDGILDINGQTLSLGNSATVAGSPAASKHINATSGNVQKGYSGTGSFLFPVGDGTAYSPITLNFTTGAFSSGSASVNLTASKHPNNSSSSDFINRYWTVNSSGITGFSCAVTAAYDDGDIEGGATEADMVGGKWDGADWVNLGAVTAGSNQITGTVSSFSDFTAGEPAVFPVEWLYFTAKPQTGIVLLDWATASEINSDFFAIERSTDRDHWNKLGKVSSIGNSSELQSYRYKDLNPLNGTAYYRLRQVDLNGKFEYSKVVEVTLIDGILSIYPNPASEVLTIDWAEAKGKKIRLIDMQGRLVLKTKLDAGINEVSISHLPEGLYILQYRDQQGHRKSFQIVKQ